MLKGKDKGIMGENVRELKNKGLSERDAVMASMKSEKKVGKGELNPSPVGVADEYPYGTRLELDQETLGKLGHTSLPQVGDTFHLRAKARVTSASEHSNEGEDSPRRSVSLQITHMGSQAADDTDEDDPDYDTGTDDSREE